MSDDLISRSALLVRMAKVFVPANGFGQGISMGIDLATGDCTAWFERYAATGEGE